MIVTHLPAQIVQIGFRVRIWPQENMIARNCLDAGARNFGRHFIFKVGSYFQVFGDSDDQNLVKGLAMVIGIKPTRYNLGGLSTDGTERNQQEAEKKCARKQVTNKRMRC